MSRTGATPYVEAASYYTRLDVASAVVGDLAALGVLRPGMKVGEPHVGGGAWLKALEALRLARGWRPFRLVVGDIRPEAPGLALAAELGGECIVGDFLTTPWPDCDVIVGNPPFSEATEGARGDHVADQHIDRALTTAPRACLIVRTGIFSAASRKEWALARVPEIRLDLCPRPGFEAVSIAVPARQAGLFSLEIPPAEPTSGSGGKDTCEYAACTWGRLPPASGWTLQRNLWWR